MLLSLADTFLMHSFRGSNRKHAHNLRLRPPKSSLDSYQSVQEAWRPYKYTHTSIRVPLLWAAKGNTFGHRIRWSGLPSIANPEYLVLVCQTLLRTFPAAMRNNDTQSPSVSKSQRNNDTDWSHSPDKRRRRSCRLLEDQVTNHGGIVSNGPGAPSTRIVRLLGCWD